MEDFIWRRWWLRILTSRLTVMIHIQGNLVMKSMNLATCVSSESLQLTRPSMLWKQVELLDFYSELLVVKEVRKFIIIWLGNWGQTQLVNWSKWWCQRWYKILSRHLIQLMYGCKLHALVLVLIGDHFFKLHFSTHMNLRKLSRCSQKLSQIQALLARRITLWTFMPKTVVAIIPQIILVRIIQTVNALIKWKLHSNKTLING